MMPRRAYRRWRIDEDDALINFLRRGREMDRILICFGRSEGSIRSRIMHLYKKGAIQIEPAEGDE